MGLDDFQLFDQRRKRKALDDITNRNQKLSFKLHISSNSSRLFGRESGKVTGSIAFSSVARQKGLLGIDKISTEKEIFWAKRIKVLGEKATSEETSSKTDTHKLSHLLLLNLKNVVSETKFGSNLSNSTLHFDFVHSLVNYNAITRESNESIREFSNRQKLNQMQSLRHVRSKNVINKPEKNFSHTEVVKSTQVSTFITAISTTNKEDCLLLNTSGKQLLDGKILVLKAFRNYNLLGKHYRLYTEWEFKI